MFIDRKVAESIIQIANILMKHDYPLCENHFTVGDIEYVYKAMQFLTKIGEELNEKRSKTAK